MTNRLKNAQTAAQNAAYYDDVWAKQGELFPRRGYARIRMEFVDRLMKKYILPQAHHRLQNLELGCGTGWLSAYMGQYGDTLGIDFAPKAIDEAQKHLGDKATYMIADPASPTLGIDPQKRFDVVLTSEVIEHVEDHKDFLKQINNFLEPNGWLILTTPNADFWEHYKQDKLRFEKWAQPVEQWINFDELKQLLAEHGFELMYDEGWPDPTNYTLSYSILSFIARPVPQAILRKLRLWFLWPILAKRITQASMFMLVLARKRNNLG